MNILGKILKGKKPFSFSVVKEIGKVDKYGNKDMTISYKIKFIDSARFMASSLSNLVDIISQKEFIKLNAKIAIVFLNTKVSMTI